MRENTLLETTISDLSPEDVVMNGWVEADGVYVSLPAESTAPEAADQ